MSAVVAEEPRLLHSLPGRMRVHVPAWSGQPRGIETRLRQLPGVKSAQANPLTGNILIGFDPAVTDQQALLAALRALEPEAPAEPAEAPAQRRAPERPHVLHERYGAIRRARIPMRGLDRNPQLARKIVEHLERWPGVQAHASPLTGRVLVEFSEHEIELDDLIAEITGMELPEVPGEDRPTHPLDPGPLIQSSSRLFGAALGLGIIAARRALGIQQPIIPGPRAAQTAVIIGILQGFPFVRNGLRRLLGRNVADVVLTAPGIITLTLSGSPLGLALAGAEALRLLTEVLPRRSAWRRYEEQVRHAPSARPGKHIRLEAGERAPRMAKVLEGVGTSTGLDGLPAPAVPGATISAGAPMHGGPFVLELQSHEPFTPAERPAPVAKTLYDRYQQALSPVSLAFALGTGLLTRSFSRALQALVLVNPRVAVIGKESADLGAAARALRGSVTVVSSASRRAIRLPHLLLFDGPRVLTDGFEVTSTIALNERYEPTELQQLAAGVSVAAGSPWGRAFPAAGRTPMTDGTYDGAVASAVAEGIRYSLEPFEDWEALPASSRLRYRGDSILLLRREREEQPLALFALRPRLAEGVTELVRTCQQRRVELGLIARGNPLTAQSVGRRAGVPLVSYADVVEAIRARQAEGALVGYVADGEHAAEAFAACDLAIGLTDGRSHFPARVDLLAPDLGAITAIIEAGARHDLTVRDSVGLSLVANSVGVFWGLRGEGGLEAASTTVYGAALGALAIGWQRLRGGERPRSALARISDPHPERWGQRTIPNVLRTLNTTKEGLTTAQALERRQAAAPKAQRQTLGAALLDQLRSPLTGILAAGAGLSLVVGAVADVGIIAATIGANVLIGAWQERQAGRVAETLERLGTTTARVLRDGQSVSIPASEVVPGDMLLLATGDRVAADARVISASGLEVDEAALTGESLPVSKAPTGGTAASRILLEGSDVTSGTGRAVVVAVGRHTRMGATAAALALDETKESPLGARLSRLLRQTLPLAAIGGAIVTTSGLLRNGALAPQLAIGASLALAAVPEGLPLLASVGEAAVARRLAGRHALVRRLAAIEALGRVDVACTDKTGTMTQGRLALRAVASVDQQANLPGALPADLRHVLLIAALASPHPDALGAGAHPTDVAVTEGALSAGLGDEARARREAESPFDPMQSFHAAIAQGRLCVKGAPEALAPRCQWLLRAGERQPLAEDDQQKLLDIAQRLADEGLRVLLVAEGTAETPVDNPQGLVALGFVGISDPLRPSVRAAVQRCQEAGVRVIMLTGDHPATARAIAREAGLLRENDGIITATELAELQNGELDERLAHATVIARATPLDKVRIIESLRRQGHTVAMTGDGVNDAPALRLADVGVAMGKGGTEVARQTAEVVLADDDFSTLVETLVEGRSFWGNIRRALSLLLGGNLGEVGLMVGAGLLAVTSPLSARQILAVNLVTDVLPGLAVALQQPEHRHLASLAREGASALDESLRKDVLRRGLATAAPALAAYLLSLGTATLPQARTVAFSSIVATQLAQTLDVGGAEGSLSAPILGAVGGSAGLLVAALAITPLRTFLGLAVPTSFGWALIAAGALAAPALSRLIPVPSFPRLKRPFALRDAPRGADVSPAPAL